MRMRSVLAALCVLLPIAASAVPIEIELIGDTSGASTSEDLAVVMIDGVFDPSATTRSFTTTNLLGSFYFNQVSWYDGHFSFWGGNWSDGCRSWLSCKLLWLRLKGEIHPPTTEIPEPSAALLFGAGAFVVSRRISRRR